MYARCDDALHTPTAKRLSPSHDRSQTPKGRGVHLQDLPAAKSCVTHRGSAALPARPARLVSRHKQAFGLSAVGRSAQNRAAGVIIRTPDPAPPSHYYWSASPPWRRLRHLCTRTLPSGTLGRCCTRGTKCPWPLCLHATEKWAGDAEHHSTVSPASDTHCLRAAVLPRHTLHASRFFRYFFSMHRFPRHSLNATSHFEKSRAPSVLHVP